MGQRQNGGAGRAHHPEQGIDRAHPGDRLVGVRDVQLAIISHRDNLFRADLLNVF